MIYGGTIGERLDNWKRWGGSYCGPDLPKERSPRKALPEPPAMKRFRRRRAE